SSSINLIYQITKVQVGTYGKSGYMGYRAYEYCAITDSCSPLVPEGLWPAIRRSGHVRLSPVQQSKPGSVRDHARPWVCRTGAVSTFSGATSHPPHDRFRLEPIPVYHSRPPMA